jgi:hypothetical protein
MNAQASLGVFTLSMRSLANRPRSRSGRGPFTLKAELDNASKLDIRSTKQRAQHAYLAQQHKQIESIIEQQTADVGRVRNLYDRGTGAAQPHD